MTQATSEHDRREAPERAQGSSPTEDALLPRPRRRRLTKESITKILFVVPAGLFLVMFFGYPVVQNITMSLQEYTTRTFFTGEAPWVGFANYTTILGSQLFSPALLNTILFTVGSIAGQFTIGLALATFFVRRFPLNSLLRSLLLLPWLLPLIVASATWRSILDQDSGILNQFLGSLGIISEPTPWLTSPDVALIAVIMVNIWIGIPFNVAILYGGLKEIPEELYEAGALDGATGWSRSGTSRGPTFGRSSAWCWYSGLSTRSRSWTSSLASRMVDRRTPLKRWRCAPIRSPSSTSNSAWGLPTATY